MPVFSSISFKVSLTGPFPEQVRTKGRFPDETGNQDSKESSFCRFASAGDPTVTQCVILSSFLFGSSHSNPWTLDPLNPLKIINSFGDDPYFFWVCLYR
jgi:hypothetical protein